MVRSVIGELLHIVHLLGGKVVSVTTDGFITDISDLETKALDIIKRDKNGRIYLLNSIRELRSQLSNDPKALELKSEGYGIISWSTRGQFSKDSGIIATTGLQRKYIDVRTLESLLTEAFNGNKQIDYISTSLRSALDIYKRGGHVTRVYRDQRFRLNFDGRREIQVCDDIRDKIQDGTLD